MASDYKDAKRWINKALLNSSTERHIQDKLNDLQYDLGQAHDLYHNGDYESAKEKMEEVVEKAEEVADQDSWPTDGYDYNSRFRDESIPAMKSMLEKYKNAVN